MDRKEDASIRMRGHHRVQMKENDPRKFSTNYHYANIRYGWLFAMRERAE